MEGRLLAIVDVFDALTTVRPYHPARTQYEVIQYLQKSAGRLFDPHLVPMFVKSVNATHVLRPDGPW